MHVGVSLCRPLPNQLFSLSACPLRPLQPIHLSLPTSSVYPPTTNRSCGRPCPSGTCVLTPPAMSDPHSKNDGAHLEAGIGMHPAS